MLSEFLLSAKIIKTFYDLHAFSGPEKAVEVNHDSVNNINEDLTQPRIFWHLASYIWIDYISIEDSVIFDLDALVPRYIDSSAPLSSSKSALNQFKFSQKRKKSLERRLWWIQLSGLPLTKFSIKGEKSSLMKAIKSVPLRLISFHHTLDARKKDPKVHPCILS